MAEAVEEKVRKGLRAADFRDAAIRPISCVNIVKNGPNLPLLAISNAAMQPVIADNYTLAQHFEALMSAVRGGFNWSKQHFPHSLRTKLPFVSISVD